MSLRWPAFGAREAVLADLERAIAATPAALDTRFYYASFLRDHGRLSDAVAVFEAIRAAAPDHVETLVALSVALARAGRRLDARAVVEHAVAVDPAHDGALVNLANLLSADDPVRAAALYRAALAVNAAAAPAHRGLCTLAAARGDAAEATRHRAAGYAAGPFVQRHYFGSAMPIPVVALISTDGGNIPLDALLDPHRHLVTECYVEAYRGEPLPAHALVVNAIGDADRAAAALQHAAAITAALDARAINPPAAVERTGRLANAARLGRLDGVIAPATWLLRELPAPPPFPLIVREPGFHMGRGMIRVDDAAALERAVHAGAPRADRLAIRYVETRSSDGAWRKYRVMAIGGALLPLHLAIAHRWDVHYFSSAMRDETRYRAEEAAFLASPEAAIGTRAWEALGRVRDMLGLDYAGIDFALAPDGGIVVFEANAAMTVLPPDPDERFRYRQPAADRIRAALAALFGSDGNA